MKITIVVGGRWHAFDLARELYQAGYLHKLITNYPRWFVTRWGVPAEKVVSLPLTFWLVKMIYWLGGEALMMRCQWRVHQWFATRAVKYLEGSDLIHGWSQWSEPSLRWAKARGVPTLLERSSAHILEQGHLLREEYARLGFTWTPTHPRIEAMELREYELCTTIAVPSSFVQRSFLRRGFSESKLYRNSLGVDLSRFHPPAVLPNPPEKSGLKVIYAGSLSVRKGIHDLLEGFHRADLPNAELTLAGGCTPQLADLVSTQPTNVKILGHRPQSELVKHYGHAHCFVMPSIEEGMAMVQMQALACGLPLICTANTGGEDLLRLSRGDIVRREHGVIEFLAGFLMPINNPQALAWCLNRLAVTPGLWLRKRDAALAVAARKLDWASYCQREIDYCMSIFGYRA